MPDEPSFCCKGLVLPAADSGVFKLNVGRDEETWRTGTLFVRNAGTTISSCSQAASRCLLFTLQLLMLLLLLLVVLILVVLIVIVLVAENVLVVVLIVHSVVAVGGGGAIGANVVFFVAIDVVVGVETAEDKDRVVVFGRLLLEFPPTAGRGE